MTDRPIMFSGAMVRALLAGTKTQTRRLATSPLRRVEAGDRLWVRESYRLSPDAGEAWHPEAVPCMGWLDYRADSASLEVGAPDYAAVERVSKGVDWDFPPHTWKPSIHQPRWASRLTLIVEAVRVEPLQSISDIDARDEGVDRHSSKVRQMWLFGADAAARERIYLQACSWEYRDLWDSLHDKPGERWTDNPAVVALTFRIERRNIDAPPVPQP